MSLQKSHARPPRASSILLGAARTVGTVCPFALVLMASCDLSVPPDPQPGPNEIRSRSGTRLKVIWMRAPDGTRVVFPWRLWDAKTESECFPSSTAGGPPYCYGEETTWAYQFEDQACTRSVVAESIPPTTVAYVSRNGAAYSTGTIDRTQRVELRAFSRSFKGDCIADEASAKYYRTKPGDTAAAIDVTTQSSGGRLRPMIVRSADGLEATNLGYMSFDSEIGTTCYSMGSRCKTYGEPLLYPNATCASPVAARTESRSVSPRPEDTSSIAVEHLDDCSQRIYRLLEPVDGPTTPYTKDGSDSPCRLERAPSADTGARGLGVPREGLRLATSLTGSGRIRTVRWTAPDGSMAGAAGHWDTVQNIPCQLGGPHDDGTFGCVPSGQSFDYHFADASCVVPLLSFDCDSQQGLHAYVRRDESQKPPWDYVEHAIGDEYSGRIYQKGADGCTERPADGRRRRLLGAAVRVVKEVPMVRETQR